MKSINYAIVELDEAYNNSVELSTGDSLIVNSTIEDVNHINRVATVVETPDYTIIQKGDKVVCHHNIFRLRNGYKGEMVPSDYHIKDNLYFVPLTEIFMFKRDTKDWEAIAPFCFIEPIVYKKTEDKNKFSLSVKEDSHEGKVRKIGVMKYPNRELVEAGIKKDDTIIFKQWSEYKVPVDGKVYYKMANRNILGWL